MAFTTTQRAKCKIALGFPLIYQYMQTRIDGALDLVGADPDGYAIVVDILDKLEDIDNRLSTTALDVSGIQAVGDSDPSFYKGQTDSDLRKAARALVGRLSIALGTSIVNDIYSASGYASDFGLSAKYNGFCSI